MNKTLGLIVCPICGEESDLRRCERGARTWYWVCRCGKITPNMPAGQQWIMDRARIFSPDEEKHPGGKTAPEPKPAHHNEEKHPGGKTAPEPKPAHHNEAMHPGGKTAPEPKPAHHNEAMHPGGKTAPEQPKEKKGWLDW